MLWVLVGLLVFIVAILISALRKVTNSVISRRYVPPSDAIIDQIMPEEILEHIISFTDPVTFQQCLNVSRYWRSHASKTPVKKLVVERYVNSVRNSDFVKHRIEIFNDKVWIDYPENYLIDARLQDMAFAEKRGKRLLELNLAPDNIYSLAAINDSQNTSHIIKSLATLANSTPKFRIGGRVLAMAEVQDVPPVLTIKEDGMVDQAVKYEVMLNLDEYCKTDLHKVNIFMIRNLTEKKNRFGFVPVDESFLSALAFLVIPLVVHDVLHSEPFMNVLKLLAGPLSCGILTTVIARDNFDSESNLRSFQNAKLFRTLVISTIVALAIGFLVFYPVSSTHWAFIGIVIGVSAYAWMLFEYVYGQNFEIQTKHTRTLLLARAKERKQIMYVCFVLLLLMVDWPVTIQTVIDGRFWYRLLWNTMHYLVFVSYAIWNNFMACVLQDSQKKFRWSYFYDWERSLVEQFAYFYGSVVYVTLCAPNWRGQWLTGSIRISEDFL